MTSGGKRDGSGRPRFRGSAKRKMFACKLDPMDIARIKELATKQGKSQSQVIEDLLHIKYPF